MALVRTRACFLGRTAPYAALGLVLIWHPSWIFTAFFAALFAALALNFPGRRKRQLDAIGVDRELSKGSFVAKGDARRDPDRPVHGDDDGDGDDDDDGGDDANFVAKLEHQYHDFVDMIMYTEHVFNEVSVVLEQGLAIFTWGDERISGVLALVFFLCVFVPVAFVPPPLFYKVFFTFPYIVDPQGRQTGVKSSTGCVPRDDRSSKISEKTAEIEVGNFAPLCCPGRHVPARARGPPAHRGLRGPRGKRHESFARGFGEGHVSFLVIRGAGASSLSGT